MENSWLRQRLMSIVVCLFLLTVVIVIGCKGGNNKSAVEPVRKVTIGIQTSPAMTLVMVAKDKGFFLKQNMDVELKEFTAGKFALQAFLGRSIDYCVSGEVPVALASLQGNDIRVVSQVVEKTTNEVRVVATKDGIVSDPASYFKAKKRKLATSIGGGPEFYTYNFLKKYNIGASEVEIISQNPADMPAALESGSVDAISIFDPFAYIAEKRMGDKVVTFSAPDLYSELYVLSAHPDQITKDPEAVKAIMRALVEAAQFIEDNPAESKSIMQKYTKLDDDIINGIWSNFVFKPALTNNLIEYWNAEAAWAKETNKITADTKIPNFRSIIDDRFLREVKPGDVSL